VLHVGKVNYALLGDRQPGTRAFIEGRRKPAQELLTVGAVKGARMKHPVLSHEIESHDLPSEQAPTTLENLVKTGQCPQSNC
jgi:hypothetical protein